MKVRLTILIGLLMFAVPVSAAVGDETPPWVQKAVAIQVPTYDKEVPAVVLVDESMTTIGPDGKITEAYNYAVRILRREGRDYAEGNVGYLPEISKVKEFRAWLIRPGGETKRHHRQSSQHKNPTMRREHSRTHDKEDWATNAPRASWI